MRIDVNLAAGRRMAEDRMSDTCRVTKPGTGDPVFNENTGQYDNPAPEVVYEGKCRVPARKVSVTETAAGEATWRVGEFPLDLPVVDSGNVAPGQVVTYLTAEYDPSLVGRVFGIVAPDRNSQATARSFRVKEVVG